MKKTRHHLRTRLTALLLSLVCVLGLFPTTAFAAADTIKLKEFGMSGVAYQSAALGRCTLHQMYYDNGGKTAVGFCGTKGGGMGSSIRDQTWSKQQEITDTTVKIMMAYYYAHSTGVFTDAAKAVGADEVWGAGYTWYMNAWVQACIWRYQQGGMGDPVTACAEELMAVYNSLEGTHYTNIDEELDGRSFRYRTQFILDGGIDMWGDCKVYEYKFTGAGSSTHPASSVQKVILGELTPTTTTHEDYSLIVKKVDATNPSKGLPGAEFHIQSENGSFSKDVVTGADGTYKQEHLDPGTYAVTETKAPDGYEIDNAGPQYVVLPGNGSNTVTVTFTDTPPSGGEGKIRKVDADNPSKGLAGAVIKITGVDNDFTGTYVTGEGGYLTDVPWDTMPTGSYVAEEMTPPEGFTKSTDQNKVKQTFVWDKKTDVSLVFENNSKVKIQLLKKDDSGNPLPGAVFNILKDGQIVGTEATKEDGSITVTDVTEGMYAFVEVSAPAPYAKLDTPLFAHVDQATINGGGTVTVTGADKKLPIVNKMKGNSGVPLSPPPYGYIKNPDDPRFWVIDPEPAAVVRRIYQMALDGFGLAETAAALERDGICNPTYYWRSKGTSRGGSKSTVEPTKWGHTTIKKILTLQEYCGDVINFKSYSKSYKMKKRIENPEENRAIFLNVHEAIIDRATWEKVQNMKRGTRRRKPTVTQEPSIFSGVLKCPECGGNLNFHFNQGNHDIKFFSCQNHNSGLRKCSKTHYIRLEFLTQVVLYEVHRLACFANEYEDDFIKTMMGRSASVAENDRARKQRELDGLLARDKELDVLFEKLYEDNVNQKISDTRFSKMSQRYEQEQGENAKRIKALRLELKKSEGKRMDIDTFLETVRRYTNATEITQRTADREQSPGVGHGNPLFCPGGGVQRRGQEYFRPRRQGEGSGGIYRAGGGGERP